MQLEEAKNIDTTEGNIECEYTSPPIRTALSVVFAASHPKAAQSFESVCRRLHVTLHVYKIGTDWEMLLNTKRPEIIIVDSVFETTAKEAIQAYIDGHKNHHITVTHLCGTAEHLSNEDQLSQPITLLDVTKLLEAHEEQQRKYQEAEQNANDNSADTVIHGPVNAIPKEQRPRILVAEDNEINRLVIEELLQELEPIITLCCNGKEAVDTFDAQDDGFDIVLMDCEMPIMDGLEATRQIRSLEQERGLPPVTICGLSAHAIDLYKDRGIEAGMDNYITKPIEHRELFNFLRTVGLA